MARPGKYNKDVMKPIILKLAKVGACKVEIAAAIDINRDTLYDWIDSESPRYNSEFSDIIAHASTLSQSWWTVQGRTQLENKDFSATLFNKQIAGRFPKDWKDNIEVKNTGAVKMFVVDSTDAEL